jgi:hypothetical protein
MGGQQGLSRSSHNWMNLLPRIFATCLVRPVIPENVGMLISGHRTNSVYRRYNIIDMEVIKEATAKIEEHQGALKPDNSHRNTTDNSESGADDKTNPVI